MNAFSRMFILIVFCLIPSWIQAGPEDDYFFYGPYETNVGLLAITILEFDGENYLEVSEVFDGPGKQAGLQVDDIITKVNGVGFSAYTNAFVELEPDYPREVLGIQIYQSYEKFNDLMTLDILRENQPLKLTIKLPPRENDHAYLQRVLSEIEDIAGPGKVLTSTYSGTLMGLILLANGDRKHADILRNTAHYFRDYYLTTEVTKNWSNAYVGTFLGEYYLATLDESVLPAIQKTSGTLAKQSDTGAHGHSGYFAGYNDSGLQIVTTHAVLAWALAEKCGIPRPQPAWDDCVRYFDNEPGVGYTRGSNKISDSMGRTAIWHLANSVAGVNAELLQQESDILAERYTQFFNCHTTTFNGFWACISGIYTTDRAQFQKVSKYWHWYTELTKDPFGPETIVYQRGRVDCDDDGDIGFKNATLCNLGFFLVLQKEQSKLFIHGGREYGWYTAKLRLTSPAENRQVEEGHIVQLGAILQTGISIENVTFLLTDQDSTDKKISLEASLNNGFWQTQWPAISGRYTLQAIAHINGSSPITSATQTIQVNSLQSGLLAHYSFNEGLGTELRDLSGHGYHATLVDNNNLGLNGWQTSQESASDGAYSFNGNPSTGGTLFQTAEILGEFKTIAFWWKPQYEITASHTNKTILSSNFSLIAGSYTSTLINETLALDLNGKTAVTKNFQNRWYHICLIWDEDESRYNFYIDAIQEVTIDKNHDNSSTNDPADLITNRALEIGGHLDHNTFTSDAYADLRIYDRALSEDEITKLIHTNTDIFPAKQAYPSNFTTSTGQSSWYVDDSKASEGRFALRSGAINHGEETSLEITREFNTGLYSAFIYVDAHDSDALEVYIDNMDQPVATYSGGKDWHLFTYTLSKGSHRIRFTYKKDTAESSGLDAAFIDNVTMPESLETFEVRYIPFGEGRVNGSAQPLVFNIAKGSSLPTVNAVAEAGYGLSSWNGPTTPNVTISGGQIDVSDVDQDMTFTAEFSALPASLETTVGSGGNVELPEPPYTLGQALSILCIPDNGKQISSILFNGFENTPSWHDGTYTFITEPLTDDTNTLLVTFKEASTPPEVTLIQPLNGSILERNNHHTIEISATSDEAIIERVSIYINGTETADMTYDNNSQSWTYDWLIQEEIFYSIRVRAYDNHGAEALSEEWAFPVGDASSSPNYESLDDGLIALYHFEGSTETVKDSSGNAYHGMLWSNDDPLPTRGQAYVGKGLSFYDNDNRVELPQIDGEFRSITFYAQLTAELHVDSGSQYFMRFGDYDSAPQIRFGKWTSSLNREFFSLKDAGGSCASFADDDKTLSQGWHHFALVWDDSLQRYDFYVDGLLQLRDDRSTKASLLQNTVIQLGVASDNFGDNSIDELRIYDRALTASEISRLALPPIERTGSALPEGFISGGPEGKTWGPTSELSFEGNLALASPEIGNDETIWMETTAYFEAGQLSFNYLVSSNSNDHFLEFYIDDMENELIQISGDSGWRYFTTKLQQGLHTIRWQYRKNSDSSRGLDVAMIDGLSLPPKIEDQAIIHLVNFSTSGQGTMSGNSPQNVVRHGSSTAVTAEPFLGYKFSNWSGDYSGSENPLVLTNVVSDMNLTANFLRRTYTLTFTPGVHGAISDSNKQNIFYQSSSAPVTAIPDNGYLFSRWLISTYDDDAQLISQAESTNNPLILQLVKANTVIQPVFTASNNSYTVTLLPQIGLHYPDADLTGRSIQTVAAGSELNLSPEMEDDRLFRNWTGDYTGDSMQITGISANMTLTPETIPFFTRINLQQDGNGKFGTKQRSVKYNQTFIQTVTPNNNYQLESLTLNGVPQYVPLGQTGQYTYTSPLIKSEPTFNATFTTIDSWQSKPTVSLTAPVNSSYYRLGQNVIVSANVIVANAPIAKVDFYADDLLIGTDNSPEDGWSITWSPSKSDLFSLTAVATDNNALVGASRNVEIAIAPEKELIAKYTFSSDANSVFDSSDNALHGGMLNGAAKGNSYLHLDGLDDSVYIAHSSEYLPEHTTMLWLRTNNSSQDSNRSILDTDYYTLGLDKGQYEYKGNLMGPASFVWAHLAIVNDGSTTRLYRDGSEVSNFAEEGQHLGDLILGLKRATGEHFACDIYDLEIRSRALSPEEVSNAAALLPEPPSQVLISANAESNGSINPLAQSISINGTTQFTITPDNGYEIDEVTCSAGSGSLDGNSYTTPALSEDTSINVSFRPTQRYSVTVINSSGGSVSETAVSVVPGGSATFQITPDNGFHIASVTCSAGSGSLDGNSYTTATIQNDSTVLVNFEKIPKSTYQINAQVTGIGGFVSPTLQSISEGEKTIFTITPAAGYGISEITFNGLQLTLPERMDYAYTFTSPSIYSDSRLLVRFSPFNNTPPLVSIFSPDNNTIVSAGISMPVSATVISERSIEHVNFYANGLLIGLDSDSSDGFTIPWTPNPGSYAISAVAFDSSGTSDISPAVDVIAIDKPGLLVEYLFDETFGTVAADTSGNGYQANLRYPDDTAWVTGYLNNAFSGNATVSSNRVETPTINGDFRTIAFHFKTDRELVGEDISESMITTAHADGFFIKQGEETSRFSGETITIVADEGLDDSATAITTDISMGWHHLAYVWNETTSSYDAFLDGEAATTLHRSGVAVQLIGNTSLRIASGSSDVFDNFVIYDRSLPPEEIKAISQTENGELFSLIASTESNGSVSESSQTVANGHPAVLSIMPDAGFEIDQISCSDSSGELFGNEFIIPAMSNDTSVHVSFKHSSTPLVNLMSTISGSGGTVNLESQYVELGNRASVTIVPLPGFEIDQITCSAGEGTLLGNIYTTPILNSDTSLFITFNGMTTPSHTVTFELGSQATHSGGGELIQTITNGEPAIAPLMEIDEGWSFKKWDQEFNSVTTDMVINAVYTKIHTVRFDIGQYGQHSGGGNLIQIVDEGSAANEPTIAAILGWAFKGWDKNFDNITTDTTIHAVYSSTTLTHTVTFNLDDKGTRTGGGGLIQTITNGQNAIAPEFDNNNQWIFIEWDKNFDNITTDTTVTALYKPKDSKAISDFDNDGKDDILWRHKESGRISIWFIKHGADSKSDIHYTIPDSDWSIIDKADFSGDGKADLLWRHKKSGRISIWLMNGHKKVIASNRYTVPDSGWQIAAATDFNGDHKADILWSHKESGRVAIWLMDGINKIDISSRYTVPDTTWRIVGVGDFNGDSETDILWKNSNSDEVLIWLMKNTERINTLASNIVPLPKLSVAGIGDSTGNGRDEILWHNEDESQIYIWQINNEQKITSTQFNGPGTNWEIAAVADLNGNGKIDLLWHNSENGKLSIWHIDSSGKKGSSEKFYAPDLNWKIK